MRLAAVLLALCGLLVAQNTATVDAVALTEGQVSTTGKITYRLTAEYIHVRNGGLPDNWGGSWTPEPFFWDAIDATTPGRSILAGGVLDVKVNGDAHSLARPNQFHYRNHRNGVVTHPAYAQAATRHFIDGGASFFMPFVKRSDPWDMEGLLAIGEVRAHQALAFLEPDEARIAKWPWLRKVLDSFTYDATSLDINRPAGQRNVGWLLIPENFMKRWPGESFGLPKIRHWYGLGTREAGTSLRNEHYDAPKFWLLRGLRSADPAALTVGKHLIWWKCCYGLIDCDAPNPHRGRWRNESGDNVRGTTGMAPSAAKEWDEALLAAYILWPADPIFTRAVQVRGDYWKHAGQPWNGAGGARNLGRALLNLDAFYRATGDPAFADKARQFIDWAMTVNGSRLFWKETSPNQCSGGEGVLALVGACRWVFDHGVRPEHGPHLQDMIAWYCANAGRFVDTAQQFYRASYFCDPTTTPATPTWSGDFQGCFWLGLRPFAPATLQPTFDAIERYAFTRYATRADEDCTFGGEGPGYVKWRQGIIPQAACR